MSIHQPVTHFDDAKTVSVERRQHRAFDLHPALFALTVGGYLTYVAIMAATFMTAELVMPTAIFVITIVAGFLVPALWARVEGPRIGRQPDWAKFMEEGVDTWGGHVTGRGVVVQVLLLPAMLLLWAVAIAIIRASV
jgi:hypothetical protein